MVISLKAATRLEKQLCEALRRQLSGQKAMVPEAGRDLWRIFLTLSEARGFGQVGPNPVSFAEIEAWARLMRVPIAPHHVAAIRALDAEWLDIYYAKQGQAKSGVKTLPPVSSQPLSADLFDITMS